MSLPSNTHPNRVTVTTRTSHSPSPPPLRSPATGANALPAVSSITRNVGLINPYSYANPYSYEWFLNLNRPQVNLPGRRESEDPSLLHMPADLSSIVSEVDMETDSPTSSAGPLPLFTPAPLNTPKKSVASTSGVISHKAFTVPPYLKHSVFYDRMQTHVPLASLSKKPYPSTSRSPIPKTSSSLATITPNSQFEDTSDWSVLLPTCWNLEDRCSLVEVSSDGLNVSFCGSGKNGDRDAAAVRANRPMPSHCGVYYFEVEIVSKGQSG